jgi:hypothetical protein
MSATRMDDARPGPGGAVRSARLRRIRRPSHRTRRALLLALGVSLLAAALGPVGTAGAATLTIVGPGSVTNDSTPAFSGYAEESTNVTVTISGANGAPQVSSSISAADGSWKFVAGHLPDGTYTAEVSEEGEEAPGPTVTFTVDTTPPQITLGAPANGSSTASGSEPVSGTAGVEQGDASTVTIQLFSGATIGAEALEALTVPVSNGAWSGAFGGLGAGTYTVRAEQSDWAGNVGVSAPATFTDTTPAGPAPPAASFQWFPAAPNTGENVSLVSSSTDLVSPITSFAWALTPTAAFQVGKPLLVTSFAAPGGHVVRLRVTDGNGLSSVATEMITVKSSPLVLMQPFPIVRIAGSETRSGVRISLLTAEGPPGSHITVTCKGHGCPVKSAARVAVSSRAGPVPVSFRSFERSLRAGVTLEVFVYKSGEIGKYTRFVVRRGKLPQRVDMCLNPTKLKPLVCPSS